MFLKEGFNVLISGFGPDSETGLVVGLRVMWNSKTAGQKLIRCK